MTTIETSAVEQRSLAWYRGRLGKITGSAVGDLMSRGRDKGSEFSAKGLSYLTQVASERMIPQELVEDDDLLWEYLAEVNVSSKAMRIGTEREHEARSVYEVITGQDVGQTGGVAHKRIKGFASSPDGIVKTAGGSLGTIEIKCPTPQKYMEYRTQVKTPEDLKRVNPLYYWQCVSHMAVTGASWCDFVVYCPYSSKPLHIVSIVRDDKEIAELEGRVMLALKYVEDLVKNA